MLYSKECGSIRDIFSSFYNYYILSGNVIFRDESYRAIQSKNSNCMLGLKELRKRCNNRTGIQDHSIEYLYDCYMNYHRFRNALLEENDPVAEVSATILQKDHEILSNLNSTMFNTLVYQKIDSSSRLTKDFRSLISVMPQKSKDNSRQLIVIEDVFKASHGISELKTIAERHKFDSSVKNIRQTTITEFITGGQDSFRLHEATHINADLIRSMTDTISIRSAVLGFYGGLAYCVRSLAALGLIRKLHDLLAGKNSEVSISPKAKEFKEAGSQARLAYESGKLRNFVTNLKDAGRITEDELGGIFAELRPPAKVLFGHFRDKARNPKRFGLRLSHLEIRNLQKKLDQMPIYGYMQSGAAVKRVTYKDKDIFVLMTFDNHNHLTITSPYTEKMFREGGGMLLEEMDEHDKERFNLL